jgi:hypothetical protein
MYNDKSGIEKRLFSSKMQDLAFLHLCLIFLVVFSVICAYAAHLIPSDLSLQIAPSRIKLSALKVLSSEMDPAEIRFIRKALITERGAEVFNKNPPVVSYPWRVLVSKGFLLIL